MKIEFDLTIEELVTIKAALEDYMPKKLGSSAYSPAPEYKQKEYQELLRKFK